MTAKFSSTEDLNTLTPGQRRKVEAYPKMGVVLRDNECIAVTQVPHIAKWLVERIHTAEEHTRIVRTFYRLYQDCSKDPKGPYSEDSKGPYFVEGPKDGHENSYGIAFIGYIETEHQARQLAERMNKCACGVGQDTNGDGDCAYCGDPNMKNLFVQYKQGQISLAVLYRRLGLTEKEKTNELWVKEHESGVGRRYGLMTFPTAQQITISPELGWTRVAVFTDLVEASTVFSIMNQYEDARREACTAAKPSAVGPSDDPNVPEPRTLNYNNITHHFKSCAGRVLTVIDAAYVNDQQNKAAKKLVKKEFREQLNRVWNAIFHGTDSVEAEDSVEL